MPLKIVFFEAPKLVSTKNPLGVLLFSGGGGWVGGNLARQQHKLATKKLTSTFLALSECPSQSKRHYLLINNFMLPLSS